MCMLFHQIFRKLTAYINTNVSCATIRLTASKYAYILKFCNHSTKNNCDLFDRYATLGTAVIFVCRFFQNSFFQVSIQILFQRLISPHVSIFGCALLKIIFFIFLYCITLNILIRDPQPFHHKKNCTHVK